MGRVPFTSAAGVTVHYVEHGPDRAAATHTAVLLHGFLLDHRVMTGCFEPVFADRPGWRRVYLDLPGMGQTVAPPHLRGTDDLFDVVRAAVARLVPEGRFALCGESYGGYLARGLVAADPAAVTGLALVCPVLVAEPEARDLPAHTVLVAEVQEADAWFADLAVVRTGETLRRARAEVLAGLAAVDPEATARFKTRYAGTFPVDGHFTGPALFVLGRQDSVTGYRDVWPILANYPRATLAVLDRAGHLAQLEQPGLFSALVEEWLDRVEEHAAP
jgi:pimeloyl-ACP methyl ester carboxylesterase